MLKQLWRKPVNKVDNHDDDDDDGDDDDKDEDDANNIKSKRYH